MKKITCGKCENILELSDGTSGKQKKCPVCGEVVDAPVARTSKLAVASLACSVFAAVLFFVPRISMFLPRSVRPGFYLPVRAFTSPRSLILLFILFLSGVVFGYIARSRIRNSKGALSGAGSATAGIRLGWVGIAGYAFVTLITISFVLGTRPIEIMRSTSPDMNTELTVEAHGWQASGSYSVSERVERFLLPARKKLFGFFHRSNFPAGAKIDDMYIDWSDDSEWVSVWLGEYLVWAYNLKEGRWAHLELEAFMLPFPGHLEVESTEDFIGLLLNSELPGESLMAAAARRGELDVILALASAGVCVDSKNHDPTPLYNASAAGHLEIVRFFLERGADPNSLNYSWGFTPLGMALSTPYIDVAEELIRHGADVNARRRDGNTYLMHAARAGRMAVVEFLLAEGADPRLENDDGYTALDLAKENNHPEIAVLLEGRGME